MKRSTILAVSAVVVVGLAVAVAAFLSVQTPGTGTLAIGVTDSPLGSVSHIYLTISSIELQSEANTSFSYQSGPTRFDLLSLMNVTKMLDRMKVPAGNYSMIRFTITSAIATINGQNTSLRVPGGEIKIPLSFQIKSGATTSIVIDITDDYMNNISASGNLRPVVTVKSVSGPS